MPSGTSGVKRKRRPAQRGVQAVFTPASNWKGNAQLALGLVLTITGALAWAYATRSLLSLGLGKIIPWDPGLSAFLLPVSIPLLIAGAGLSTYYLAMRRTWRASNRIESALFELEALIGQKNGLTESTTSSGIAVSPTHAREARFGLSSGAIVFALAEALVLLVIYGGLVQEYASNLNMRNWVQANFEPGRYLLTYNAVLALAGVLGVLIFQLVPRQIRSRKIQSQL